MNTSQYDTETKAQVLDDARRGRTSLQISADHGIPASTARTWIGKARKLAIAEDRDPRLVDGEYRLAYMGQLIQESQLNDLAEMIERGESTLKYMVPTNITKGTSYDKIQKESAPANPGGVIVNIIFKDAPIIEGEVVG